MNSREKFHASLSFEPGGEILKAEYAYWAGTVRNWFKAGLPVVKELPASVLDDEMIYAAAPLVPKSNEKVDFNVGAFLGLDYNINKFPLDFSPMLEKRVLEETDELVIFTDNYGITKKVLKKSASVPEDLDTPIKTLADWQAYKERYEDNFPARLPKNWNAVAKALRERDFPIRLGGNPFGFLGFPRHLMGVSNYLMGLYDQPELIRDINEFALNFVMRYWATILDDVEFDCVFIFEDMTYKSGSLVSMEMFDKFMAPYYVRLIDFLKQYNVRNIFVDSDGLIDQLVPRWVNLGVTGVSPLEAVTDTIKLRSEFPQLQMMGGIDKRVLINGTKAQIDKELEKVTTLLPHGGYIPHIDHAVPMDAKWENFVYYRKRLDDIIDNFKP